MEIVENFIFASRKKKKVVIHSVLPFNDFVRLLDILFDAEYKNVTEISHEDFHTYYMNTDCHGYSIDRETYEDWVEKLKK
jgi:hypothetical protein